MTTTLVILAHPESRSFNGAWAKATQDGCHTQGDTVLVSDLTQMGFDPVERATHYTDFSTASPFDPLKAQEAASEDKTLPQAVQTEIEKVLCADRLIFHFPIWWFAPPAILKGWCDRVLAHGATHTVDQRFDAGRFTGRKALFCVTTGSGASESAFNGKEGDIQMLLWPLAYTLRYLGFSVLKPKIVHGVHGYHTGPDKAALSARLIKVLEEQSALIGQFDDRPLVEFNADDDFDAQGQLKADRPSVTPFIRHTK